MEVNSIILDEIVGGYWEAAIFTEESELGGDIEISNDAYETAKRDCLIFYESCKGLIEYLASTHIMSPDRIGHDIWLTRNGHGVGFWDRPELSETFQDVLTAAAERLGRAYLSVGNDGLLYLE